MKFHLEHHGLQYLVDVDHHVDEQKEDEEESTIVSQVQVWAEVSLKDHLKGHQTYAGFVEETHLVFEHCFHRPICSFVDQSNQVQVEEENYLHADWLTQN